ncbi:MAG: hypothetical protein KBT13_08345 [Bacteroidales bacterium]|nr:hypothetical protein [Candidatus Sodaliphilus limicaballi]
MKKTILSLLVAMLNISAMAGVGILRPNETGINVAKLDDGTYPVAFDPATVKTTAKGYYITFEVFTVDVYDGKLLAEIEPGDNIITGDGVIDVKSVKVEDGHYTINENEEGCLYLEPQVADTYVVCGDDDYPTYTSQGTTTLFVPVSAKMRDDGIDGDPMKSKNVLGQNIGNYLKTSWSHEFCVLNTTITVKNGKVVKIHRSYMP